MDIVEFAQKELNHQAKAIQKAADRLNKDFKKIVKILFNCNGKIVVTGMGKTGIIARKIASTLSSTGSTATFLHAAEGIHGDLGILQKNDVVIAVSYSGNTEELVSLIPYFKLMKIPIIAITGNKDSELAADADYILDSFVPEKYEPFGLVPTASTTVALALGDAIAVSLLEKRNFKESDFAKFHPGGTIGKKLIIKVEDLMHSGENNPIVSEQEKMDKVILEMTSKGLGCTSIVDAEQKLVGIITDGDLRRIFSRFENPHKELAKNTMTTNPKCIKTRTLAIDALNVMEDNKITMIPVVNDNNEPIGMLHLHDIIDAGIV